MDDCTLYNDCPSKIDVFFGWLGDHFMLVMFAVFLLILLAFAVEVVGEKHARIIERLGKYHRVMHAGLHLRIPFIERVVEEMELWVVEITKNIKAKTLDNVFVTLPVTVQYKVQQDKVREAYYELEEPEKVITSLVLNEVKTTASGMTLEDIFTSREEVEDGVNSTLEARLGAYGYEIVSVVVDNPKLSKELEQSFNGVMAAQREQDAATAQAEALRIQAVGEATANAEGLKINAAAQVFYRDTIAKGNAAAVKLMVDDTGLTPEAALRYFEITDTNDAIRDAAGKQGTTIVVASPRPSDGLYATGQQ